MQTLGVIGGGFVGTAVREGMRHAFDVHTYDLDPSKRTVESIEELLDKVDGPIFVAVPTPMLPSGQCDTSIVERVIKELSNIFLYWRGLGLPTVVIKSTVPPGTTASLQNQYRNINLVFNPEFLTEANYLADFKNQDRIILGGIDVRELSECYAKAYPLVPQFATDSTTAELVKYIANSFLALKVTFANEIFDLAGKLGVDFEKVIGLAKLDKRLGQSHWQVPGPDGHRGYSGHCLVKDLLAIVHLADSLGAPMLTLKTVDKQNRERFRPNHDWELLKGRAVV